MYNMSDNSRTSLRHVSDASVTSEPGEKPGGEKVKKRSSEKRRRRGQEKVPRLRVKTINAKEGMAECVLETTKQQTVTFIFNLVEDSRLAIADNLVRSSLDILFELRKH